MQRTLPELWVDREDLRLPTVLEVLALLASTKEKRLLVARADTAQVSPGLLVSRHLYHSTLRHNL